MAKYMKRCSASMEIRMQSKTAMRCHYVYTRLRTLKSQIIPSGGEDVEEEDLHPQHKLVPALWETFPLAPQN